MLPNKKKDATKPNANTTNIKERNKNPVTTGTTSNETKSEKKEWKKNNPKNNNNKEKERDSVVTPMDDRESPDDGNAGKKNLYVQTWIDGQSDPIINSIDADDAPDKSDGQTLANPDSTNYASDAPITRPVHTAETPKPLVLTQDIPVTVVTTANNNQKTEGNSKPEKLKLHTTDSTIPQGDDVTITKSVRATGNAKDHDPPSKYEIVMEWLNKQLQQKILLRQQTVKFKPNLKSPIVVFFYKTMIIFEVIHLSNDIIQLLLIKVNNFSNKNRSCRAFTATEGALLTSTLRLTSTHKTTEDTSDTIPDVVTCDDHVVVDTSITPQGVITAAYDSDGKPAYTVLNMRTPLYCSDEKNRLLMFHREYETKEEAVDLGNVNSEFLLENSEKSTCIKDNKLLSEQETDPLCDEAAALWDEINYGRMQKPYSTCGQMTQNGLIDTFHNKLIEKQHYSNKPSLLVKNDECITSCCVFHKLREVDIIPPFLCPESHLVGHSATKSFIDILLLIPEVLDDAITKELLNPLNPENFNIENISSYKGYQEVMMLTELMRANKIYNGSNIYVYGSVRLRSLFPDGYNDNDSVTTITIGSRDLYPASNLESSPHGQVSKTLYHEPTEPKTSASIAEKRETELLESIEKHIKTHSTSEKYLHKLVKERENPVLKLHYEGKCTNTDYPIENPAMLHIDVSVDKARNSSTISFLRDVDVGYGNNSIFKRSLILLKAWASFDAHILGSQKGYMDTYALTVLLIAMLNQLPADVLSNGILSSTQQELLEHLNGMKKSVSNINSQSDSKKMEGKNEEKLGEGTDAINDILLPEEKRHPLTPLKVLMLMLEYYSNFDFDEYVVTIFGPVPVSEMQRANEENAKAAEKAMLFDRNSHEYTDPNCTIGGNISPSTQKSLRQANGGNIFGRLAPPGNENTLSDDNNRCESRKSSQDEASACINSESKDKLFDSVEAILGNAPGVIDPPTHLHYTNGTLDKDFINRCVSHYGESDEELRREQYTFYKTAFHSNFCQGSDHDVIDTINVNYFSVSLMNVRDPMRPHNNLCKDVRRHDLARIQHCFRKESASLKNSVLQMCYICPTSSQYIPSLTKENLEETHHSKLTNITDLGVISTTAPITPKRQTDKFTGRRILSHLSGTSSGVYFSSPPVGYVGNTREKVDSGGCEKDNGTRGDITLSPVINADEFIRNNFNGTLEALSESYFYTWNTKNRCNNYIYTVGKEEEVFSTILDNLACRIYQLPSKKDPKKQKLIASRKISNITTNTIRVDAPGPLIKDINCTIPTGTSMLTGTGDGSPAHPIQYTTMNANSGHNPNTHAHIITTQQQLPRQVSLESNHPAPVSDYYSNGTGFSHQNQLQNRTSEYNRGGGLVSLPHNVNSRGGGMRGGKQSYNQKRSNYGDMCSAGGDSNHYRMNNNVPQKQQGITGSPVPPDGIGLYCDDDQSSIHNPIYNHPQNHNHNQSHQPHHQRQHHGTNSTPNYTGISNSLQSPQNLIESHHNRHQQNLGPTPHLGGRGDTGFPVPPHGGSYRNTPPQHLGLGAVGAQPPQPGSRDQPNYHPNNHPYPSFYTSPGLNPNYSGPVGGSPPQVILPPQSTSQENLFNSTGVPGYPNSSGSRGGNRFAPSRGIPTQNTNQPRNFSNNQYGGPRYSNNNRQLSPHNHQRPQQGNGTWVGNNGPPQHQQQGPVYNNVPQGYHQNPHNISGNNLETLYYTPGDYNTPSQPLNSYTNATNTHQQRSEEQSPGDSLNMSHINVVGAGGPTHSLNQSSSGRGAGRGRVGRYNRGRQPQRYDNHQPQQPIKTRPEEY